MKRFFTLLCLSIVLSFSPVSSYKTPATEDVEWIAYGSDWASTKFSPASLITKKNVGKLTHAWTWNSPDFALTRRRHIRVANNETTPIMVNGRIYISDLLNQVSALDPSTGKQIWNYDPKVYNSYRFLGGPVNHGYVQRGLVVRKVDDAYRVYLSTNDGRVIALDAETGKIIKTFGENGVIILKKHLTRGSANVRNYGNTSPALVCRDTLVVGSSILDTPVRIKGRPPGDVHGFDIKTGKFKWVFHTVPQGEEFGTHTWENNSWKINGNANVWPPMSADEELGQAYLPTGAPSNDFYGGKRPGDNLFADSVVSVDCNTGKRVWHYQLIHHGLWDYDTPAAPVLVDTEIEGRKRKLLVQVTKQAFAYVFDRVTGEPVWPIEERPVPQSKVPGEKSSPTQPFPTWPLAYDRQGVTDENLINFTPELNAAAKKIISRYQTGPLYTPPGLKGTISLPGLGGGSSWNGAAYSPVSGKLYVPSITQSALNKIICEPRLIGDYRYMKNPLSMNVSGPRGLPLFKPPYGRVTAIDMKTGIHSWMKPIGRGPKDHPALKGVHIDGDLGWDRKIFVIATPEVVFAVQQGIIEVSGVARNLNGVTFRMKDVDPYIRALDPDSGEMLAEIAIPKNAWGSPMTYVYQGKQYFVIPFGGTNKQSGLMAFSVND